MTDRPGLGFLHLGYPKGASTFLQKEVFVPAQGIYNIFEDAAWERFLNLSLLRLQGQDYAEAVAGAPPLPDVAKGTMLGLSYENILGQGLDCGVVLARLRALFGDVPVMIVIRKQEDLLFSTYVNSLRSGYFGSYAEFMHQAVWDWRNSVVGRVRYGRMYHEARRHFSTVTLMVFEDLRRDRAGFLDGLSGFLGRPVADSTRQVNVTEGASGVLGWRIGNRFLRHGYGQPRMSALPDYVVGRGFHEDAGLRQIRTPYRHRRRIGRIVRYLDRVFPARAGAERSAVEAQFAATLDTFYAEDNRALSQELGLDLGRHGYRGCGTGESE